MFIIATLRQRRRW